MRRVILRRLVDVVLEVLADLTVLSTQSASSSVDQLA